MPSSIFFAAQSDLGNVLKFCYRGAFLRRREKLGLCLVSNHMVVTEYHFRQNSRAGTPQTNGGTNNGGGGRVTTR